MLRYRKHILQGILFVLLFTGTLYLCLRGQNVRELYSTFRNANPIWLCLAGTSMFLFYAFEALNLQHILRLLNVPATFFSCISYTLTGFFFSSITPSASGGQPMELLAMHRDHCPPAKGTLALFILFCSFQIASISLSLFGFLLWKDRLCAEHPHWMPLFLLGLLLSTSLLLFLMIGILSPSVSRTISKLIVKIVRYISHAREKSVQCWINEQYHLLCESRELCRVNKRSLIQLFPVSFLQMICYHSVLLFVSHALSFMDTSLIQLLGLQAVLFVSVSSLPAPGSMGLSEGGFLLLYQTVFPQHLLPGVMLLCRGITFYLPLIFSGLFLLFREFLFLRRTPADSGQI